ncbi:hypothetical protein TorRG33x02_279330 [Trema orientale]|uniref:Uncharacterized protein n=1 Tax=Trema orientale TaxID=63057 RepID=A0A2P5CN57_TREOI|nr:hypothetical protein TorRG33x02_279330 [Trema orientale]
MRRNQTRLGFGSIRNEAVEKNSIEKAIATERAMHVTRKKGTKTMAVAVDFWEEMDEEVESMLKERRDVVGLGWSSS